MCNNNEDCSNNGVCYMSICYCNGGFSGPRCADSGRMIHNGVSWSAELFPASFHCRRISESGPQVLVHVAERSWPQQSLFSYLGLCQMKANAVIELLTLFIMRRAIHAEIPFSQGQSRPQDWPLDFPSVSLFLFGISSVPPPLSLSRTSLIWEAIPHQMLVTRKHVLMVVPECAETLRDIPEQSCFVSSRPFLFLIVFTLSLLSWSWILNLKQKADRIRCWVAASWRTRVKTRLSACPPWAITSSVSAPRAGLGSTAKAGVSDACWVWRSTQRV